MLRSVSIGVAALVPLLCCYASADVYELRTYTTHSGALQRLNDRFQNHTVALFQKHGMQSVGYWVPTDEPESQNTLIYVLRHASRDAASASWKAFLADPAWHKVAKESRADGPILARSPESVFLQATDYSPTSSKPSGEQGVYELRTYRTHPEKLKNLDARFRDHTMQLFEKHGMHSVAYWHPVDDPDSSDTLIYILRHQSREAARESWRAFLRDEEWKKVARESQQDGRILRARPEAVWMTPTEYSALQ